MVSSRQDVGPGWTPQAYTDFAVRSQLRSMWLLAHWIAGRARAVPLAVDRVLDGGAGPAILSRYVAAVLSAHVEAACQDGFDQPVALPVSEGLPGTVRRRGLSYLTESSDVFPMVFSYGYFHETADHPAFLRTLMSRVAPGGLLLVIDTVAEARAHIEKALAEADLPVPTVRAIVDTFTNSLTSSEIRAIAARTAPGATVAAVEFDDELAMVAELSMPDGIGADLDLDVPEPTLAALSWRRPDDNENPPHRRS